MGSQKADDIFNFQMRKDTTLLYKNFLTLLEDLREDHRIFMARLKSQLSPEQYKSLENADYFGDNKFNYLRKKVLDYGNDTIRRIEEQAGHFDITFGFQEE